jgi:hypothetical protein
MHSVWHILQQHRFAILLTCLLALLALPPILIGLGRHAPALDLVMSLAVLAAIVSLGFEPYQRLFALVLGLPTLVLSLGGHTLPGQMGGWAITLAQFAAISFLFGAAGLIVRSLFSSAGLSFDSILGAVCGYLFVGLGWAVGYTLLESFEDGSFVFNQAPGSATQPGSLPNLLIYFSFVTLTTVGYGDVLPVTPVARTLAWMEAVMGQFYLAVIVAGLVSLFVSAKPAPAAREP